MQKKLFEKFYLDSVTGLVYLKPLAGEPCRLLVPENMREWVLQIHHSVHMAGHMGQTRVTTQNLQVVKTDADRGLILIKGAIPGSKGAWIMVRDAVKAPLPDNAPRPAALREANTSVPEAKEAPVAEKEEAVAEGGNE